MISEVGKFSDPPARLLGKECDSTAAVDLILDDAGMKARFLGGFEQMSRGPQFDTTVRLEDGRFATLVDCVQLTAGQRGWDAETSPWFAEAALNLVFIGDDAWPADRPVRQLRFAFPNATIAFHYGDHFGERDDEPAPENSISTSIPAHINADQLVILRADSGGYLVTCELRMSASLSRLEPNLEFAPFIKIESEQPRTFSEIHRFASHVLTFFELSLGTRCRMFDVRISEQTTAKQLSALRDDDASPSFHEVRLPYGSWQPSNAFLHPGYLVFPVYDRDDREKTSNALQAWLDRIPEWQSTYALASFYLGRTGMFDRDRLLRATAWFESLPTTDTASDVTAEQIAAITAAAQAAAKDCGRGDLTERILGLVSNLAQKSLRRQLVDMTAALRSKFGSMVPSGLEGDLGKAAALRSRASHGRRALDDDDATTVIRSIRALEFVCLLSTVGDLLDAGDAKQRIGGHHPLAGYRFG